MASKRIRPQAPVAQDRETQNTKIWLEALLDFEDKFTEWERNFYTNVSEWFEGGHKLSPNQYETLEKIYRKFY